MGGDDFDFEACPATETWEGQSPVGDKEEAMERKTGAGSMDGHWMIVGKSTDWEDCIEFLLFFLKDPEPCGSAYINKKKRIDLVYE